MKPLDVLLGALGASGLIILVIAMSVDGCEKSRACARVCYPAETHSHDDNMCVCGPFTDGSSRHFEVRAFDGGTP